VAQLKNVAARRKSEKPPIGKKFRVEAYLRVLAGNTSATLASREPAKPPCQGRRSNIQD
jgi:hypothetical protein